MKKIRTHLNFITLLILLGVFVFLLINMAFADIKDASSALAPEPTSMILITTGLFGWVVRFARRRFNEFKRFFDIFLSIVGIIISAPLIIITGLFIKIVSRGPMFYKQERVGWGGKRFFIYKLRTMKLDAEKESGPVWARKNDPRLITCGKIIRKMHLDEFPQLFNVIKGEMSIVGPRPERPIFVKQLSSKIYEYEKRLNVKPGITGLAQVWHKYDETLEDVKKKIKYDLLYIRKMCLMVDIRILLRTIVVALQGKGAR